MISILISGDPTSIVRSIFSKDEKNVFFKLHDDPGSQWCYFALLMNPSTPIHPHIQHVLYSSEQIKEAVHQLAQRIDHDYADTKDLLVVGILKGAFIFLADLIREIHVPCSIGFMALSSYGNHTSSSGEVRILMDLNCDIKDKDVLIVEDILDTGTTIKKLLDLLQTRHPKSISVACLIKKPNQIADIDIKYYAFQMKNNEFIIGYGMDYAEKYRELGYVGILKPELYQELGS